MRKIVSLVLFLSIFAIAMSAHAEHFEKDGYIIDAAVTSECQGETCRVTVSGTVSGSSSCIILTVTVFAVDNNGKEVKVNAATSRTGGASPLSGKSTVTGAGNTWTIKAVEPSCHCS
ncbi:MAG: hypothetical protein HQK99_03115 [Nitrospirae bacterium]|nr:hypothetical protein [Nitrospirota bacterium]